MTEIQIPYSLKRIEVDDQPKWGDCKKEKMLKEPSLPSGEILLANIEHYVNQTDPNQFSNFERASVIKRTGYHAEFMRAHACGISCTWMASAAIAGVEFLSRYPDVGSFTEAALSYHTNDLLDRHGQIIKKGTPVFSPKNGWYHNALVGVARELSEVDGFRMEDLTLEELALTLKEAQDSHKVPLAIVSVKNQYWRQEGEPQSNQTHLVIVNGIKIDEAAAVSELRVNDPYAPTSPKKNIWIPVDSNIRNAFTGRAIVLQKSES